jgi:hypothetical protein
MTKSCYPEPKTPLHVHVTTAQQATLRDAAARSGVSVAAIVRQAIDNYISPARPAQEVCHAQ